uniref:ATG7_N domain-containing protein n=1 Tax=Rhabditophanes sp. KR3021 TaxID=114890 RepID=A0AC35U3R9_9BILA
MSVRYMRKKKSGFDNHEEEIDDGAPTGTIYIARFKPNPFHMWADLVGNPKVPASSFLVKKRPFARSGGNILLG